MKEQPTYLPIDTLIDFCHGNLSAEEHQRVADILTDNEFLQATVDQLNTQPAMTKETLTLTMNQSMTAYLRSPDFAKAIPTPQSATINGAQPTTEKQTNRSRTAWLWLLGMLGLVLLALLGIQQSPNNQGGPTKNGLLSLFAAQKEETPKNQGVTVSGHIRDAGEAYVLLMHRPRLRGNINFEGFKSFGQWVDDDGNFTLQAEQLVDGGNYSLKINDRSIQLVLFNGDNIYLDIEPQQAPNIFYATGTGAGKLNVLTLPQMDYGPYEKEWTIEEFTTQSDSTFQAQMSLLDAIYAKDKDHEVIKFSDNPSDLLRIIDETPLSEKEYQFLKTRIWSKRIIWVAHYITYKGQMLQEDAPIMNLSHPALDHLKPAAYEGLDHLNDNYRVAAVDKILQIEFLRHKFGPDHSVTFKESNAVWNYPEYNDWQHSFLKDHFQEEVYNRYFANLFAWVMSLGDDNPEMLAKLKDNCTNVKYLNRISEYQEFLNSGLKNNTLNLGDPDIEFDEHSFHSLLEGKKGQPIYIVFWNAKFAGSEIIGNLPKYNAFEEKNRDKLKMIYVCIDEAKNKNLWAARILDNDWDSEHYFMPVEDNECTLDKFSSKSINSFCLGGATYAIVNKWGDINTNAKSPMELVYQNISKYLE